MQNRIEHLPIVSALPRALTITLLASLMTFSLFVLMDQLTRVDQQAVADTPPTVVIDAVFEPEPQVTHTKKVLPPPPEPRVKPETPPLAPIVENLDPGINEFVPQLALNTRISDMPTLGMTEGQATPMVRYDPDYPLEALRDGTEGWVKLMFDIDPTGRVVNVRIVQAEPARVFDREAKRALLRWKYKPQIHNGQAITQADQIVLLSFNLSE
ncbi:energy transducer TonB [Bowmanella denitrificans]|uniref:energy transducer TonB n=1 Tax=Bowmanella denitrificans TaxID=366582 RepID=UPI000C99B054|nr:energy transducer TonB [Bowmanella denitrificans]